MIEIDIAKASNHHLHNKPLPTPSSFYQNDDTDISEPDTALNTPTGSIMNGDGFSSTRRYSSSSTTTTSYSYNKRRPSFTPKSSPEFLPSPPPPAQHQPQQQQQLVESLEKKIQALENDLSQHVKREMDLESKLLLLTEKQKEAPKSQYKSTLTRIGKQIDQFLVIQQQKQQQHNRQGKRSSKVKSWNSDYWTDSSWRGIEILNLYEESMDITNSSISSAAIDIDDTKERSGIAAYASTSTRTSTSAIPILLVYRLKSMIDDFAPTLNDGSNNTSEESSTTMIATKKFIIELYRSLNSWQEFYNTTMDTDREKKIQEQIRVSRLLQALQKSLLKNKIMKQDHELIVKKYKADMKHLVKEVDKKILEQQEQITHQQQQQQKQQKEKQRESGTIFNQSRLSLLEKQVRALEKKLHDCQDETDEYETTLEMMRREMQTMLEELEDTRQQRARYKIQASRLRAGLEAIQKKKKLSAAAAAKKEEKSPTNSSSDEDDDEEEDEGREAIRFMYNEAERQAVDLDRECKRQALTLSSVRQELKQTEEKYHAIKSEKSKELKNMQRINEKLSRDIEMLQLEKHELISLQQQQKLSSSNSRASIAIAVSSNGSLTTSTMREGSKGDNKEKLNEDAKIYALQIALKAAKSEAIIQSTKLSQLERQSVLVNLDHKFVAELQNLFQKELAAASAASSTTNKKEVVEDMANIIELEQKLWKFEALKNFQKKYDVNLLRVNREIRILSNKLVEAEDEAAISEARHLEKVSLMNYQSNVELEKRLQQQTSMYRLKEQELQDQLEIMYQKNQTLQDESLILYGRNMLMAQKLGKIAT